MSKKDIKNMVGDWGFCTVKLISGRRTKVDVNSIVGYCHYCLHSGYLTISLLNEHQCCEKECSLLEKFVDYPYWEKRARQEEQKQKNKEKLKKQRLAEAIRKSKLDSFLEGLREEAQEMADYWYKPILITRVAKMDDNKYTIFFVSDEEKSGWYEYRDIAFALCKKYHAKFILKRMKNPDGSYATPLDWENRGKP